MIEIASMSPEPSFGVRRLRDGALAPLGIGLLMALVSVWTLRPGPLGITVVLTSFVVPAAWCSLRSAAGVPRAHAWRSRSFFLSLTAVPLAILGFLALDTAAWLAPRPLARLVLSGLISAGWISEVCFRNAARVPLDPAAESLDRAAGPRPLDGVARLAAPAIACVLLVLDFGAWSESRRADAERTAWAAEILDQVVALGAARPLDERIGIVLSSSTRRPAGARFFTIWGDGRVESLDPDASVTLSRPVLESIDARRDRRDAAASVRPRAGEHVAAYRTLGDGRVLVLRLDRAPLYLVGPAPGEGLGFLALILVGVIAHARSLDRHRREAIARVEHAAERLARGDLLDFPAPTGFAGELSRVEHDLVRAARRLDATVERAAGVDETARSAIETLEQAFAELRGSASGRAEELSELRGILERIREQVAAATRKADTLDRALDESAHSVSELGAAGAELNETAAVLTSRVDAVSDSLEQMVRSVKEVGATTDQLAEASEETSSSMEQMASAMRAVDNAAETTANISSEVVEKAELGQAKVVQTIAGMEAIREATDAAERVIRGLGARTKEIGGILDVIDDVADETNLLALNAAIIAAQAGEHGKAFSVVADEIKELADRVLASTKEIGALIRAVQEESENAIGAIAAGSSSVMSGVDLSAEAGRTLEEITIASRESGARIREIVSSVREQTKAASHVVTLMERVRESADQIGAASAQQEQGNEVVYRSALTMREVAQQLQNTTAEQAMGLARIRDNSVGVRSVLEELSRSLASQTECCDEVARRLDGVGERGRTESVEVEAMRRTVEALVERLAQLREDEDGPRRRAGVGESRGAGLAGGERR